MAGEDQAVTRPHVTGRGRLGDFDPAVHRNPGHDLANHVEGQRIRRSGERLARKAGTEVAAVARVIFIPPGVPQS